VDKEAMLQELLEAIEIGKELLAEVDGNPKGIAYYIGREAGLREALKLLS